MTLLPNQIFTTSSRCTTYPGRIALGDNFASPKTLPRGVIPVTGRGPLELHSTYYLTSDTSSITVHINSRLPPPTTAQRHVATHHPPPPALTGATPVGAGGTLP
ncbi:hypothetical protein TIFTF001_013702 [Ficus carica]|uniref:Uncharacterized protein n=1 Tax=Ficus carica TaxID=3494 RepID=A0AA88D361_FICCA|nr:hypothetical protein TIFTF001_013702 [Ficus carica]